MCPIPNGFQDTAISLYNSTLYYVHCTDEQEAMRSQESQIG
jgi:hypothetical protein